MSGVRGPQHAVASLPCSFRARACVQHYIPDTAWLRMSVFEPQQAASPWGPEPLPPFGLAYTSLQLRTGECQSIWACAWSLSHVRLFATPWTVTRQAYLSMGFSRQEYWSGLPFPTQGYFPDPGIQTPCLASSALAGGFFTTTAALGSLSEPIEGDSFRECSYHDQRHHNSLVSQFAIVKVTLWQTHNSLPLQALASQPTNLVKLHLGKTHPMTLPAPFLSLLFQKATTFSSFSLLLSWGCFDISHCWSCCL